MAQLPNFPIVSQLTQVTGDGHVSNNAQMDCVAACIDAVCRWLLNDPENSVFNPDHFKDEAYSEQYTGGTAATQYVPFCEALGVYLYPVDCQDAHHAVAMARQLISKGKPAIFTEVDPYVDTSLPRYAGWSHVCVWHQSDGQGLTAMDPYIARNLYKTDAAWSNVLVTSQLWTAELITMQLSITTPGVSSYYKEVDANHWQVTASGPSHGLIVQYAMLDTYKRVTTGNDLCGLTWMGLPLTNEIALDAEGNVIQFFERGCWAYKKTRKYDSPPGSGDVYACHVYGTGALGQDPHIKDLLAQIAALQKQVADLQSQIAALKATPQPGNSSTVLAQIAALVAQIQPLEAQIVTLAQQAVSGQPVPAQLAQA